MKNESFVVDLEEYPDDPIRLNDYKEFQGGAAFQDFQTIDAEIIDYGICEDECEETSLTLKSPSELSKEPSAADSNSSKINDCKRKCACIKVVDCDKYPWYYVKYKKQILERRRKHRNAIKHATDIVKCLKDSMSETFIDVEEYEISKKNETKEKMQKDEKLKKKSDIKRSFYDYKNTIKPKNTSQISANYDVKQNTEKNTNKINTEVIDFKKNKGLVGMKVQKMVEDDKIKECNIIKKKKTKRKENAKSQIEKYVSPSFVKIADLKTSDNLGTSNKSASNKDNSEEIIGFKSGSEVPSITTLNRLTKITLIKHREAIQNGNECDNLKQDSDYLKSGQPIVKSNETKINNHVESVNEFKYKFRRDQNVVSKDCNHKIKSKNKPMPKSKRIELDNQNKIEVLNVMKNPKVLAALEDPVCFKNYDDINSHNTKTNYATHPATKNNVTSNKSFVFMNKFTEKVLKIVNSSPKISREKLTNDKTESIASDLTNRDKECEIKPNQPSLKPVSPVIVEKVNHTDWKIKTNKNVNSIDKRTENENNFMTLGPNNNLLKVIQNEKNDADKDGYGGSKLVKNLMTEMSEDESSYNSSTLVKTDRKHQRIHTSSVQSSINTENNLLKLQCAISQYLPKTPAYQEFASENKQSVNVNDYIKKHDGNKSIVKSKVLPAQKSSTAQQNELPIQITDRNKQKDNNINLRPASNITSTNNNTPQKKQISALVIRQSQTPNTTTARFNAQTAAASHTRPYYVCSPDFGSNAPKPLLSLSFPYPPPTIRHQIPLKQVRPWSKDFHQHPNYAPPSEHTFPQGPIMNTSFHQGGHYFQNNCMQQPIATRQHSEITSSNTNMPQGICDVLPNNVYWNYNYFTVPPPPPPLPYLSDQSNIADTNSIIGRNTNGLVKKINITTPSTNLTGTKTVKEDNVIKESNVDSMKSLNERVDRNTPVVSKSEMLKIFDAVSIESSKKNNLKRHSDSEQSITQAVNVKTNRPGPLSKKLKFSDTTSPTKRQMILPSKTYSPPILPIPTYQKILSEVQAPVFQKQLDLHNGYGNSTFLINDNRNVLKRKSNRSEQAKGDNLKKISVKEYKERIKKHDVSEEEKFKDTSADSGLDKSNSNLTKGSHVKNKNYLQATLQFCK